MEIIYKYNEPVKAEDVVQVFKKSGITRPIEQKERIQKMLDHANIILTAWDNNKLVGIARALTDFSYCCYLSDLAVDKDYQKNGIGKELIKRIRKVIGEEVALILLSAPNAMDYYPKVGFEKVDNGFIIRRKR
ncbi:MULTISPECIES: GNAT family N-acetyltransferase [Aneurinibacillus]|uniref:GNAT family N-acetyltransferase n=1 Tax=Aneurinibacillus thermoaerophilus TaxID=143495 RepID=A0A1G8A4L9_ANETH|nr:MULTISPECIES: GNAT family N-acetyltransferase [Aneurinibacillus]AMA74113.1 GCN5 family acetyltransferase [Aneurinibacillus sp. XH2]MED0675491.1 GNAT family N-acetyltransferase [Aneurinibacillus thermoaerophilus]MED0678846.1 GNAT family N-acetyltransferase [Aneurinibacillus thermoaerophilus]MED0736719.1 GNAT family N-acetyltransferase [Aneurinibacillus thermoaerophilus]MED0758374.1 GNAT family N-acetyltransferase [Aneurinibacillus thermoaerophilus]